MNSWYSFAACDNGKVSIDSENQASFHNCTEVACISEGKMKSE